MSKDLTYKYRKDEICKNGSRYLRGIGRHEQPIMSPYEYGTTKRRLKRRGGK